MTANCHDFNQSPYMIDARIIKEICQDFTTTTEEVRILAIMFNEENNLFLLPIKNGSYVIVKRRLHGYSRNKKF